MNTLRPAPPLPHPQRPAAAARAVAEAAQAAAASWTRRPLAPAPHSRAVSQLHSVLRDLGIASQGLIGYLAEDTPSGAAPTGFRHHVESGSRWLLTSWQCLDGVLAAEGIPPSADPGEPGAALCQAARGAILAWRQPEGMSAERDDTVRHLITATGFISAAILYLASYAPRRLALDLETAGTHLAAATASLTAAIQPTGDAAAPGVEDSTR